MHSPHPHGHPLPILPCNTMYNAMHWMSYQLGQIALYFKVYCMFSWALGMYVCQVLVRVSQIRVMCQWVLGAECSPMSLQTKPPHVTFCLGMLEGRLTLYLDPLSWAGKLNPPPSPAPEREARGLWVLFGLCALFSYNLISLTFWE